MGFRLGNECADLARSMVRDAKQRMSRKGIAWDKAIAIAKDYLPYTEAFDSVYIEFLNNYAKAARVPFDEIFALICQGEKNLCTDIMVGPSATTNGSTIAAHTEDWMVEDQKHVVLVEAKPKIGPSFVVVTLAGFELVTGLNSAGLSFSGNSLYQKDERLGVPKMAVARRLLASRTIGEALSAAAPPDRASSYNNNICHSSGEFFCVEGSATDLSLLYPQHGYLVHTNHYVDPGMRKFEDLFSGPAGNSLASGSSSIIRYNRAKSLIRRRIGNLTTEAMIEILSDHVNRPHSICAHPDPKSPPHDRDKTIYAVVSDLTEIEMQVCLGNPCEGPWNTYAPP